MKKIISLTLGVLVAISMVGCSGGTSAPENSQNTIIGADSATWGPPIESEAESVEIPNPFVSFDSLQEAEKVVGFKMQVPDNIAGYPTKEYEAIENSLLQVFYYSEDRQQEVLVRKGIDTEDISGNYTVYDEIQTIEQDGKEITIKGNNGRVNFATWQQNEYAFSVIFTLETEKENVLEIVKQVS